VTLSFTTFTGSIIFTNGTGSLQDYARVQVRLDKTTGLWHWGGMYRFAGSDDDCTRGPP
jgi:hypothetical protein